MTDPLDGNAGTMLATFIDPSGVEWPLTNISDDVGWFTTQDISGWGAPTFEYTLDPVPAGGDMVRFIRTEAARIVWPMHIWGDTYEEFTDRFRLLRQAVMSTVHLNTSGILRVARPDATAREIDVFYEAGFEGQGGENWISANPVITFLAPNSYWRSTTAIEIQREYIGSSQSFLNPFMTLSSGQILGESTVNNPGDVPAYPEWHLTGPMSSLTATNHRTGHEFILSYSLLAGETATITTERPTVRGPLGQNIVSSLNWPDAYLWSLLPGDNDVEFSAGGPGTGTKVVLSFHSRFNGV